MKKLILILTLILALALCFVACEELGNNSNEGQSQNALSVGTPGTEEPTTEAPTTKEPTSEEPTSEEPTGEESTSEEPTTEEILVSYLDEQVLNEFFSKLENDIEDNDKIYLYHTFKEDYYDLKSSGEYDDVEWKDSAIYITVWCNYDYAINEEWYKSCTQTDCATLNKAFFDEYCSELSSDHFSVLGILQALYFKYVHSPENLIDAINDFYVDFSVIKELSKLDYVELIEIEYWYGLPRGYYIE